MTTRLSETTDMAMTCAFAAPRRDKSVSGFVTPRRDKTVSGFVTPAIPRYDYPI